MIWWVALIILIVMIAVAMISGLWTAIALGVPALIVVYIVLGDRGLTSLGSLLWNNTSGFVLTAVPLFLLMGQFIVISRIGEGFFKGVDSWTRWLPGGLAAGTVLSAGVLGAPIGSSVATAAAVGTPALPEMRRRGYHPAFAAAAIAGGGSLGILIPPGIPLIIYGSLVGESVSKLFAGSLLPGIILMTAFIVYTLVQVAIKPGLAGEKLPGTSFVEKLKALPSMIPVVLLVVLVIATIYAGVATPTEAAALGAAGALIIAARRMTWKLLWASIRGSIMSTVMVFAIVVAAQIISFAFVSSGISRELSQAVVNLGLNQLGFLVLITLLYVVLGQIIDGVSMMLLTLPVIFPIALAVGFDPIVFGVIMCVFIELGQITPPIGLNLFMVHSIDRSIPIMAIAKWSLPYVGLMLIMVYVINFFPQTVLWLAEGFR